MHACVTVAYIICLPSNCLISLSCCLAFNFTWLNPLRGVTRTGHFDWLEWVNDWLNRLAFLHFQLQFSHLAFGDQCDEQVPGYLYRRKAHAI